MLLNYQKAIEKIESLKAGTPLLIRDNVPWAVCYNKDLYAIRSPKDVSLSLKREPSHFKRNKEVEKLFIIPTRRDAPMKIDWTTIQSNRRGTGGIYVPVYSEVNEDIVLKGYENREYLDQGRLDVLAGEDNITKFLESHGTYNYIGSVVKHFLRIEPWARKSKSSSVNR